MSRNPNWREELKIGDTVIAPDDQCCMIVDIDGDTITLRSVNNPDADTFTADRGDLK